MRGFSAGLAVSYCEDPQKAWILMKEFAHLLKTFIARRLKLSKK